MNAPAVVQSALFISVIVAASSYGLDGAPEVSASAPVSALIVNIEAVNDVVTYTIGSEDATGVDGLFGILRANFRGREDSRTIVGILGARAPIEQLTVLRGVAMKIGYGRVRFFVQDPDDNRIFELVPGRAFFVRGRGKDKELVPASD